MRTWPILGGSLHLATTDFEADGVRVSGGACDPDPRRAQDRARAEALERHTLLAAAPRLVRSSGAVREALLPRLVPDPAFADDPWWVVGRTHRDLEAVAVLARASLLGWTDGTPLPWKQSSTGSALRDDPEAGFSEALAECVERYAVRKVWRGTASLTAIFDPQRFLPPGVPDALEAGGVELHAWRVHTSLPVAVVLAALTRRDREQVTFGAAARPAAAMGHAVEHAALEAISVRAALAGSGLPRDATNLDAVRTMATTLQAAFLRHLGSLTGAEPPVPGENDLADAIVERFGVPVVRIEVPASDGAATLVRVHIPHEDFLAPLPDRSGYLLAPGYLD